MLHSPLSPLDIPAAIQIEGHAIVSADGMIAGADGTMPPGLRNDADWHRFQHALDRSALVVIGRIAHGRHPNTGRNRLVFTNGVSGIKRDPEDPGAVFFNPAGASLVEVLERLHLTSGTIAVTGGTRIFDYFASLFHRFMLAEANGIVVPDGRPCFSAGHPRIVLAAAGLRPGEVECLDLELNVTMTHWARPLPAHAPAPALHHPATAEAV